MTKTQYIRSDFGYLPTPAQRALASLPRRLEFLTSNVGPAPKRVLDVGCATGYIAYFLVRIGHGVTGLELNPRMAAEARSLGLEIIEHDLEDPLPFAREEFDVLHACEILEHLFDTEGVLKELHRVLVPGGVLILSTPNLNSLANRFRVLIGSSLPMWGAYPQDRHGGHIRVFNKAKLFELLRRTQFEPEQITGINQGRLRRCLDPFPTLSEMLLVKAVRR